MGGEVTVNDGYILARVPPDSLAAVSKALAEAGVYVTLMEPIHVTLEDFFLEVTAASSLMKRKEATPR